MIIERREHELVSFAKQEGDIWARHSFTLAFKLEWFKAIRRTLWSFLYRFSLLRDHETSVDQDDFFKLEQRVNGAFDQVFTYFFLQYSKSKDEELDKKQQDLHYSSASLMPMGDGICILPLSGKISPLRLEAITKRSLLAIEHLHIQSFIVDLSNITELKKHVVHSFVQLLEGIHMMGCRIIVTGARAEVVTNLMGSKKLLHLNIEF